MNVLETRDFMSVDEMKGVEEGLTRAIVKLKRERRSLILGTVPYGIVDSLVDELESERVMVMIEREHAEAIEIDAAREAAIADLPHIKGFAPRYRSMEQVKALGL